MSRNAGRKNVTTPVKASKRRGSDSSASFDFSDENGYSGVDDVSDSEDDDEEDVNAAEEENILTESFTRPAVTPRPQKDAEEEDDDDDDDDDNDRAGDDEGDEDNGSWAGIMSEIDESQISDFYQEASAFTPGATAERHVHFDVPPSDSDSTESEDDHADLFPDIFISQNSLDPSFRREIENDPDESSGSGSFWDFNGQYGDQQESEAEEVVRQLSDDETPTATPSASHAGSMAVDFTPAFDETLELDGYETDGDTTEEDTPEPLVRRKTHRPSQPLSDASDSDTASPVKPQRGQPRIGRFNLDRSDKKPIAVLNPLTRKMMIFTPHRRRQLDLSPEQFNFAWPMEEQSSPILSSSANMMLSAMFSSNTFGDFVNPQTMGPAEAFFPFPSEGNTADESSAAPSVQEEEDDAEKSLKMSDFITWDADDFSGDDGENGTWEPSSTPARPSTASSDVDVLSHLNSETVGAFRRNQINQQLILSNQATQDSLAFSGPYNYTALRGLKSDRFDTAGVPLTPARRQKRQMSDVTRSPLESISAKRKASSEASNGHKRHRSISDVNHLRI